jgi:hypothetical protein
MSKHVDKLRKTLDVKTKRNLTSLTPDLVAWMRPIIQEIIQA